MLEKKIRNYIYEAYSKQLINKPPDEKSVYMGPTTVVLTNEN